MQILSSVLCIAGSACIIGSTLIKGEKMKQILFLVFCANFLVATGYLVGGSGINGAASCYLGAGQAIVNYFFESKNKPLPKWLLAIYAASFIIVNLWFGGFNLLCLLAIVATLVFVLCIAQKNGSRYRFWTLVNVILWCSYDIFSKSFGALFTHVPQLFFAVVGMVWHDAGKKNKECANGR